jgi:hypothetical protein
MTRYEADLGDSDAGTALRDSMSASVSDISMPAGLLDRAVSRNRRRQARNRLAGAVGAVAVVAVAASAIAITPGRSGRPALPRQTAGLQIQTAAYVLSRAATAQVNSYRMISVSQIAGGGLVYTDVARQRQRLVSALLDSSGRPYFQIATAIRGGAWRETDVEYQHHVYSTFTASSMDHGVRVTLSSFLPLQTSSDPAAAFNSALKAGIITVVGHRSLNGRDSILIRVKALVNGGLKAGVKAPRSLPLLSTPDSWIWVDASTYLVVQTKHFVPHFQGPVRKSAPPSKATWSPVVDHVSWLPPTPANLALLTVTPPAGFTKIPYSELAQRYLAPISWHQGLARRGRH